MGAAITSFSAQAAAAPRSLAAERSSTSRRLSVCAVPVVIVAWLNYCATADLAILLRVAASATCLVACIPFAAYVLKRQSGTPFMPMLALIYGIYFGWVVFLLEGFRVPVLQMSVSDELVLHAETICLAGIVAMLVGYYLLPNSCFAVFPRLRAQLDPTTAPRSALVLGIIALLAAQAETMVKIPGRFQGLFQIAEQLLSLSIALLFFYYLKGNLSGGYKLCLWGVLLPYRLLHSMASGAVGAVIFDLLVLMGTYWVARRRWPWKAALLALVLVVPLLGVKGQYRKAVWSSELDRGVWEKAGIWASVIHDGIRNQDSFFSDCLMTAIHRFDQLTTMCFVVELTPSVVPYWEGGSYNALYWMAIPRLAYQDKPMNLVGQQFGHRYGVLRGRDRITSYNLPQIVELYANFGVWGVVLGMLVIGMVCRVVYYALSHPQAGEGASLFAVIVFSKLCNIESDFSIVFGGLLLNILAFTVILKFLGSRGVRLPLELGGWR